MIPLIVNYSHPLSEETLARLANELQATPELRQVAAMADRSRPMADVAVELANAAELSPDDWQLLPLIINPPALAPLALALIAELHGRCGYFPPILNIRPVAEAMPPRYELAEIVNLQAIRERARERR